MTDQAPFRPRRVLVTGSSGFIGAHLAHRLLDAGCEVVGLDNLSDYYDVTLKQARQRQLTRRPGFRVVNAALETPGALVQLFRDFRPEAVYHLAAQAGVRYSIDHPRSYMDSNLAGTFELLEAARAHPPAHLLLASSSSVYGASTDLPYRETSPTDHPISLYAATKKALEAMSHSYAHLFGLPVTVFRFFTVYGPWGRPDMALFKFTRAILEDRPIDVYNHGQMRRDFTYIDDLVTAVHRLTSCIPPGPGGRTAVLPEDSLSPVAPWRVVNIGNSAPVALSDFITAIENATGRTATRNLLPMQPGDILATWADTRLLTRLISAPLPQTAIGTGVQAFVDWYRSHYASAIVG